jgi:hypothetical protein
VVTGLDMKLILARYLSQVAEVMQGVLTEAADIIGRKTGFIKRLRKLSGSGFVQTLVFGWLGNPDSTVEELCQTAARHKSTWSE